MGVSTTSRKMELENATDPPYKTPQMGLAGEREPDNHSPQKCGVASAHSDIGLNATLEICPDKGEMSEASAVPVTEPGESVSKTPRRLRRSNIKPALPASRSLPQGLPTVVGREAEYKAIERQVQSFTDCSSSSVLYVTGVPGSGKTYTVINLLNYLKLPYCYVNCSRLKEKSAIYRTIGEGFPCIRGCMTLQSLRFHFNSCDSGHILIVDEVDFLWNKRETFLYNLFELPFFDSSKVLMIVISNTLGSLSTKIESRIGNNRLEFRPYSAKQLKAVVEAEFSNSITNGKSIELITKRVAASTGDIRKAREIVGTVGHRDLNTVHSFLKDLSAPLINKFIFSFNFYQKMLVFLHKQPVKTIQEWFNNHKSFCVAKNYKPLDFADFQFIVNDLAEFGVYKIKKDGLEAVCNYIEEELDAACKDDKDFIEFSKS